MNIHIGTCKNTRTFARPCPSRWLVLAVVMLAYLPISMDLTILHIAVPSLTLALKATGSQILWIIDIYPLVMAGLLVPMGILADSVGAKRLLLTGLVLFGLASLLAALAPSAPLLILARAGMAFGASMVVPCTLAIIRQTFDDWKERALALGIWSTISSVSAAAGPLAGSFLIEHFWWGAVFLINLPIILTMWPLLFLTAPRLETSVEGKWSPGQALLLMTGLIATVYALKSLFKAEATLLTSLILLLGGLVLVCCFISKQFHSPSPMLDMHLFRIPAISVGLIIAMVVSGALAEAELTIAQELQFIFQYSPLQAGLYMLPLMGAAALGGPLAGYLIRHAGLCLVSSCSLLIAGLALTGLALIDLHAARFAASTLLALLGFSLGVGLTASSIAVISSAPKEKSGAAGALESFGYDLGTGLGITIFGVLLTFNYKTTLLVPEGLPSAISATAGNSLGETMIAADILGESQGQALAEAGRLAFLSAHSSVMLTASIMIILLSPLVLYALRNYTSPQA